MSESRKKPATSPAELRRKLREAELLLSISKRIAAAESLDQVLHVLVEITTTQLRAERGTLFLHDPETGELYSRVAQGMSNREIRLLDSAGIAGHVFCSDQALIVHDAYADPRFDSTVDEQSGFSTRNILCIPVRASQGEVIGVAQTLNKHKGHFTPADLRLFEAIIGQGALALRSAQFIERMEALRREEMEFIEVVSEMTSDIKIGSLLQKVMGEASKMLNAERSTLFLNHESSQQLWSEVGEGLDATPIRFPNHLGIAGAVFKSGKTINIPYAYADLRFNPAFDKQTNFFTRSILCVPVVNKSGKTIGVTQVLNKHGGPFTADDEARLKAFTAQVSIALENAQLFADVQSMKNYNQAMLESMSNGLLTLDENHAVVTCNAAGLRMLKTASQQILQKPVAEFFGTANAWLLEKLQQAAESGRSETAMDAPLLVADETLSVNLSVQPLLDAAGKRIGMMMVMEDISHEKRIKSTMARYMDPSVADRLVASGAEVLGGKSVECTVLFSDVRGFTGLTEKLGAQGTVALLNEYFSLMVDCIQKEEGMLDKFIGDAIMAAFGIPVGHEDDADRAVRSAIAMIRTLMQWNGQRIAHGKPPVDIGVGLNTDVVVSGNIGSKKRMDFTIIGDGVNLASRLESACKQYGTRILVSEFTYHKLKGTYRAREVDRVVVKGKTQPVAIHEILDYHGEESFPCIADALALFKDGLAEYRQCRWDHAMALFGQVLEINPADKPSRLYLERCQHLKENPPPDDWGGVWVMQSK